MDKHQVRLHFNSRVAGYEDKIAHIAGKISERFGTRVDAALPLSRNQSVAKLIYLNVPDFAGASKLADEIAAFLREPETARQLGVSGISYRGGARDDQYATRWSSGRFARRLDFTG